MAGEDKIFTISQNFHNLYILKCETLMVATQTSLTDYVFALLDEGQGRELIESRLQEKGHDEQFVKELVKEAIKLRQSKRITQGLGFILAGALICFTSFLLTITGTFSQGAFPWVLYGLTSAGIIVVFAGFMRIF